jgi:hypothetical protein
MGKQPKAWTVDFHSDAVIDFEDVKSRGDRKAVFNVVHTDLCAARGSVLSLGGSCQEERLQSSSRSSG